MLRPSPSLLFTPNKPPVSCKGTPHEIAGSHKMVRGQLLLFFKENKKKVYSKNKIINQKQKRQSQRHQGPIVNHLTKPKQQIMTIERKKEEKKFKPES